MKVQAFIVTMLLLAAAGVSHAQAYRWVDKDGKVRYGDVPPTGAKATALKPPASGPAPEQPKPAPAKPPVAQKDSVKPADPEKGRQELAAKLENCARAKETLAMLQSGQRITRIDAKGERYFVDDTQRAQETEKARQSMSQWCS